MVVSLAHTPYHKYLAETADLEKLYNGCRVCPQKKCMLLNNVCEGVTYFSLATSANDPKGLGTVEIQYSDAAFHCFYSVQFNKFVTANIYEPFQVEQHSNGNHILQYERVFDVIKLVI